MKAFKRAVRNSFGRAVDSYDGVAALQRQVAEILFSKSQIPHHAQVLEIGCGTGYLTGKLSVAGSELLVLDIALPMLRKTRAGNVGAKLAYLCADAEALPLRQRSVDYIVSNLSLQWCPNLERLYSEFQRVLRPNGVISFSTFGPNTLKELKTAWAQVDEYAHVNYFPNEVEIKRVLSAAGFDNIHSHKQRLVSNYLNVQELMRELKGIGAHNVNQGRLTTLTSKNRMQKMLRSYDLLRRNGLIPATFEIIYINAKIR